MEQQPSALENNVHTLKLPEEGSSTSTDMNSLSTLSPQDERSNEGKVLSSHTEETEGFPLSLENSSHTRTLTDEARSTGIESMNVISNSGLADKRNSGENIISLDTEETKDVSLPLEYSDQHKLPKEGKSSDVFGTLENSSQTNKLYDEGVSIRRDRMEIISTSGLADKRNGEEFSISLDTEETKDGSLALKNSGQHKLMGEGKTKDVFLALENCSSQIHKLPDEGVSISMDQMNTISILGLADERNSNQTHTLPEEGGYTTTGQMAAMPTLSDGRTSEEIVQLSDVGETKDVFPAMIDKEDSLPRALHTPVSHLRKTLLVLDLNGLLADVVFRPPKVYRADSCIAGRAIFKRPFCDDFLRFCFERFEVGVWSSRTKKNLDRVVDFLMGEMKQRLLFCWDASYCTPTKYRTLENNYKPLVFKELRKLWEKHEPGLPWVKGYYNESNTLLLDDTPYKSLPNPPHTAIFPHSYKFSDQSDNSLGVGGDLRVYLEGLAQAENVQDFVEKNPFGQKPITESSESWKFYFEVISSLFSL